MYVCSVYIYIHTCTYTYIDTYNTYEHMHLDGVSGALWKGLCGALSNGDSSTRLPPTRENEVESPSRKVPRRWDCSCGVLRPCPCAGRRYTGSSGGWPRDRHLSSARCLRGDDVYDVETVEGLAVENPLTLDGTDPERPILLKLAEGGGDGPIITPQLTVGLNN